MPTKKPTGWIILSCVLALVAVGLGVWAFSSRVRRRRRTGEARIRREGCAGGDSGPDRRSGIDAGTGAEATPDPAVQEQFDQIAADLGATNASVEQIQQDLEAAAAKVSDAAQAKEDASGALDTARAEIEEARARLSSRRRACSARSTRSARPSRRPAA